MYTNVIKDKVKSYYSILVYLQIRNIISDLTKKFSKDL